jgi:predicted transcriptional regulator
MARRTGGWTTSDLHRANAVWVQVLRELREARGLMRADLVARTGLKWACVDKIERGACGPRLDSVLKICEALAAVVSGSLANSDAVATLDITISDPPTQAEMQAILDKINEDILARRRS